MKHIVDKERPMPYECSDCKHYLGGTSCRAFDTIPLEIYCDAESHTKAVDGQHGDYVFATDKPRTTMRVYVEEEE